jgi:hypothetical protein
MPRKLPRITNYFNLVVSKGRPSAVGSRTRPIGTVIGIGEDWDQQQRDVRPNETVALWQRTGDPLFDVLRLQLLTPGSLYVAVTYDTPTSWTNLTASGTRQWTQHLTLSGAGVLTLTPWAMTSPTVHPTAVSGGLPAVIAASDRTWAPCYRIAVKNPGTTTVRYELSASAVFGL